MGKNRTEMGPNGSKSHSILAHLSKVDFQLVGYWEAVFSASGFSYTVGSESCLFSKNGICKGVFVHPASRMNF